MNAPAEMDEVNALMREAFLEFNQKSTVLTKAYSELKEEVSRVNLELQQKNSELSLKNKALHETSSFLNKLFEGIGSGLLVLDESGLIVKINSALSTILPVKEKEVIGKNIHAIPEFLALSAFVNSSRKSKNVRSHRACKITLAGADLWVELSGSFVESPRNGFLVMVKDLTEVQDLRKKLTQNEALLGLGQMAVTVAHEIRNPLGGIEGFASLLKRDLASNEKQSLLLGKIISGVRHLNGFVGDLLTFAKPLKANVRNFEVSSVVERSIIYSGKSEELDSFPLVAITLKKLKEFSFSSDPDLIQQALLNLLLNAYQVMEEGGTVEVETFQLNEVQDNSEEGAFSMKSIHFDAGRKHGVFCIRDSGPGISNEIQENLFKPFFTTKSFGTGIGLCMVQKVVEVLEGRLEVVFHGGLKGAEFRLYFPELDAYVGNS